MCVWGGGYINSTCVNGIVEIVLSILRRVRCTHVLVGIKVDLDKSWDPSFDNYFVNAYILCIFVCIFTCVRPEDSLCESKHVAVIVFGG